MTLEERFWEKVDRRGDDECWPWLAGRNYRGYGNTWREGRRVRAHRVALTLTGVAVPPDKFVLHSCDNPPCVNPAHLRVGTTSENALDMYARGGRVQERKSHCVHGHPLSGANLLIQVRTGRHRCRACTADRNRAYRAHSRFSGDELTPGAGSLSRDQVRVGSSPEPRERLSAPARTPR